MTRVISSTTFPMFTNNTEWPQQLVENFLVRGARHVLIGTYGAAKSSLSLDLIGSILSQKDWLGQFAINAPNPVVFYISQDAPDMDLKNQSFKVLREYFDWNSREDARFLNARFHIVAGQNIQLPDDADAVIEMMHQTLYGWNEQGRLSPLTAKAAVVEGPSFKDVQPEAVKRALKASGASEDGATEDGAPAVEATAVEATEDDPDEIDFRNYDIVVVFDSARNIHCADESKSDEMTGVNNALKRIERATGATTIILQHENRRGTFKGDTAILDNAQQGYQLTCPPKKRHEPERDITLKLEKNRGLNVKPFIIRFEWTGLGTGDEKITFAFVRWTKPGEDDDEVPSTGRSGSRAVLASKLDPVMTAARRLYTSTLSVRGLIVGMKAAGHGIGKARATELLAEIKAERALLTGTGPG